MAKNVFLSVLIGITICMASCGNKKTKVVPVKPDGRGCPVVAGKPSDWCG